MTCRMYWHAYIPVLVGFLIGTYLFKFLMRAKLNPVHALIGAMIIMIGGTLIYIYFIVLYFIVYFIVIFYFISNKRTFYALFFMCYYLFIEIHVGFIVMLDFSVLSHTKLGHSEEARFWVGSILLTVGFNIESAAIPAIYSHIIDATVCSPSLSLFYSLFYSYYHPT